MFGRSAWIVLFLVSEAITDDCLFRCEENGQCLQISKVCNGISDCLHGSDETSNVCKETSRPEPFTFYCANGARIHYEDMCGLSIDCDDKSDNSLRLCLNDKNEFNDKIKANCRENQIACKPGECVSKDAMCNGTIECSNGRDESVDICMDICAEDNFQCGNGKCIIMDLTCDNKFDCVDGTDELSTFCEGVENWRGNTPKTCVEPEEKGLQFDEFTKYRKKKKGRKYVYANDVVSFTCSNRNAKMSGNSSNVCLYTGKWRFNVPTCLSEPINTDPNTNGSYGCPINRYNENLLEIYKCEDGNCKIPVKPPLNNIIVKFNCKAGYTMLPFEFEKQENTCSDKKWSAISLIKSKHPKCVKLCKREELFCRYSLTPMCFHKKHFINCDSREAELPGTTVKFFCNRGFTHNTEINELKIKCLNNGSWTSRSDMDQFCRLNCGIKEDSKSLMSKDSPYMPPQNAPWTVAIYRFNVSGFEHICSGIRITADLVLTAAHCVTKNQTVDSLPPDQFRVGNAFSNSWKVSANYGLGVKKVIVNPNYNFKYSFRDIAILQLNITKDSNDEPRVVCLPWVNEALRLPSPLEGQVVTWNTTETNGLKNLTASEAKTLGRLNEEVFNLEIINLHKVCKGDSGSGFTASCYNQKNEICVYGVLSHSVKGEDTNFCTDNIAVSNIIHPYNKNFIIESMYNFAKTCN